MGCGLQGCRRRLCGAALSLRSLYCQPGATDQQSASQPCTDLIPPSLSISVSLYLTLPLCQRHLLSPCLLPTPTACPATNGACLSGNLSACLSVCCSACLSLYLFFLQSPCLPAFVSVSLSVCMGACLSICLSACQPLFLANTSLAESGQAVSRSANLPDYLPVYSSSVCVSICLPVHLSACIPICVSICLLSVYLPVLLS